MITIINLAFEILMILIFARVILSWVTHNPYHPIIKIIYQITEPLLSPLRKVIGPVGGMDISPIIIIFMIQVVKGIVLRFLLS